MHVKNLFIVGVDEVGRGPIAGPVTVCACAIPMNAAGRRALSALTSVDTRGTLKDSKRMSAAVRTRIARDARAAANDASVLRFALASVGQSYIDRRGIVSAVHTAISRALVRLNISPHRCSVLLDGGIRAPSIYKNQKTIIKGDEKEPIIALASIIAKDFRDRKMARISKKFPGYGFEMHAGYGTSFHYRAIEVQGLSPVHRRSFLAKYG